LYNLLILNKIFLSLKKLLHVATLCLDVIHTLIAI
jgi:hypothetical protein